MTKKILIVDDEPDLLKIAVFRLKKAGYHIVTAVNGKEALEAVAREIPDLVLLDLLLPVIDGVEVCKRLKRESASSGIPVILFTASALDIQQKVKEAGAEDYLIKPFDIDELLEKVRHYLNDRKAVE